MLAAAALIALSQVPQPVRLSGTTPSTRQLQSRRLALADGAVAYIPASAGPNPPLLVLLHGAGHRQAEIVEHFEAEADKRGILLLAPDSRGITWDKVLDAEAPLSVDSPIANQQSHSFGRTPDADHVESAISGLAKILPFNRARIVLAGFSDGATFALAMGMSRRYPFEAVIAWSPGIAIENEDPARGRPVFISHGRQDPILKFEVTRSEIVPLVQSEGALVRFVAFDGGHDAPTWLKDEFLDAAFAASAKN